MKQKKIYAEILEETAMEQFNSAMEQDFVISGALMPDAHTGYSLPIGAVVATDNYVVPAWVGYDIGCGMCALKLDGVDGGDLREHSKEIFDSIYKSIPVGFNINQTECEYSEDGLTDKGKEIAEQKKYKMAIGSLGGGNHFIELGEDESGEAWCIIHSGSRGVGHGIATYYMKLAHPDGKAKEGHHGFRADSLEGEMYINDLNWALDFALANRKEMMSRVLNAVAEAMDMSCYEVDFSELINRNHNHAVKRNGMWIHRKGATHAEDGMMGVIPGNMRDGCFIVKGKGNADALWSSSHGAGRVLGRKEAKRILNIGDFQKEMNGITALVTEKTIDESPFAYKNIFDVMKLQCDLVDVVNYVRPIINIKG